MEFGSASSCASEVSADIQGGRPEARLTRKGLRAAQAAAIVWGCFKGTGDKIGRGTKTLQAVAEFARRVSSAAVGSNYEVARQFAGHYRGSASNGDGFLSPFHFIGHRHYALANHSRALYLYAGRWAQGNRDTGLVS